MSLASERTTAGPVAETEADTEPAAPREPSRFSLRHPRSPGSGPRCGCRWS
jgi:hypothetical protein